MERHPAKLLPLTVEAAPELGLPLSVLIQTLGLDLLPLELILLLDLQVAVQLCLTHRRQLHLWVRGKGGHALVNYH